VSLNIYNVLGQKVCTLTNDVYSIGTYEREWNGKNDAGAVVASGVYFYRITARANGEQIFSEAKKLVLMK
jgi:flagellar hook assembly protein FlgD